MCLIDNRHEIFSIARHNSIVVAASFVYTKTCHRFSCFDHIRRIVYVELLLSSSSSEAISANDIISSVFIQCRLQYMTEEKTKKKKKKNHSQLHDLTTIINTIHKFKLIMCFVHLFFTIGSIIVLNRNRFETACWQ
jgi:VP2 protein